MKLENSGKTGWEQNPMYLLKWYLKCWKKHLKKLSHVPALSCFTVFHTEHYIKLQSKNKVQNWCKIQNWKKLHFLITSKIVSQLIRDNRLQSFYYRYWMLNSPLKNHYFNSYSYGWSLFSMLEVERLMLIPLGSY